MKTLSPPRLLLALVASVCALLATSAAPQGQEPNTQSVGSTPTTGQTAPIGGAAPPTTIVRAIPPELSVVLVIDVSGSMNDNNKIGQAKQAALEALARYLTPVALGPMPGGGPGGGAPGGGGQGGTDQGGSGIRPRPPATSAEEIARMDKFRELVDGLKELQQRAGGGDLRRWSREDTKLMRDMVNNMDQLMEGVALEKSQPLLRELNPLVEKMHFSLATKVNQSLGGGHLYMVSGKKSDHPDFGGLYSNKMSDHDAIYVGARSSEAAERHRQLARELYGEDWLRRTDSSLEAGELTFRAARTAQQRAGDFRAFNVGPQSNNDWMRTVSGGGWVSDYVVEKGEVIDLDRVVDDPNPARRRLQDVTPNIQARGVSFDARGPRELGYNLGAVSDFERQYLLNMNRRLQAGEVLDQASVLQKDKYFPRFQQMLEQTGQSMPGEFQDLRNQIKEAKKLVEAGQTPSNAQQLEEGFERFRQHVRQQSMELQTREYNNLIQRAASARNSNPQLAEALLNRAAELSDDTQGALHNYQQLASSANPVLQRADPTHAADEVLGGLRGRAGGANLADRVAEGLRTNPFISAEPPLQQTVSMERVGAFGSAQAAQAAADATASGGKVVLRTAQEYADYIRNNPGTTLTYVAGVGWVGYQIYDAIQRGDTQAAKWMAAEFAGTEAAAVVLENILATKYGYAAGSGGAVVGVATLSYLAGHWLGSTIKDYTQAGTAREQATEILSGMTQDNRPVPGKDQGFLSFMGLSQPSIDDVMKRYPPGQYGDVRIEVDPSSGAVTIRRKEIAIVTDPVDGSSTVIDDWNTNSTTVTPNELVAKAQLDQMFSNMRGSYRDALDGGQVRERGVVDTSYEYSDGINRFSVPNPGGVLTQTEYEFYRKRFDEQWGRYTLGQQPWPDDELFRAKADLFRRMMESVVQGKVTDMGFQQTLEKMSPEELGTMKELVDAGQEVWVNGRRLTGQDMQDRIDLMRSFRDGELRQIIDAFEQSIVPPEFKKKIEVLISTTALQGTAAPGSVEFGVLAYEGDCASRFYFYPFARRFDPLAKAINALSPGGGTPMTPALYQARWAIWTEGQGTRGAIILLTDGQNDCSESPVKAAQRIYQRMDAGLTPQGAPGGGTPTPGTGSVPPSGRGGPAAGGGPLAWLADPPGALGWLAPGSRLARSARLGHAPWLDRTPWLASLFLPGRAIAVGEYWGAQDPTAGAAAAAAAGPAAAPTGSYAGYHQIDMSAGQVHPQRREMPITVSAIGFQVTDQQQMALDSIAVAGGGVSARADNIDQLAAAFQQAIQASGPPMAMGGGGTIGGGGWSQGMIALLGLSVLAVLLLAALVAARRGMAPAYAGAPATGWAPAQVPYTTSASGGPSAPRVKIELTLQVDEPVGGSRQSVLRAAPAVIGRHPTCDVVLTDPEVSRRHAMIVVESGGLAIVDQGSAAGTWVDGRRVDRAPVWRGTKIQLGRTTLRVL